MGRASTVMIIIPLFRKTSLGRSVLKNVRELDLDMEMKILSGGIGVYL